MLDAVSAIAREAGGLALEHFKAVQSLDVRSKGHLDLVTVADQEVERLLARRLLEAFPDDGIHGEEGTVVAGRSGRVWVLDPIDGTFNFVRGAHEWAISIGAFCGGRPEFGVVYAPVIGQLLAGGRDVWPSINGRALPERPRFDDRRGSVGIGFPPSLPADDWTAVLRFLVADARMSFRSCGSAAVALLEVARGEVDGYVALDERSWDVLGALAPLAALGAATTIDWSGRSLDSPLRFACGGPEFLALVAPLFRGR